MARSRSIRIPSAYEISLFRKKLLKWFAHNGRVFPWRKTRDPWRVLVSEVMLQRTRADQVVPIYNNVVREYPTPYTVAVSPLPNLRRSLWSLGLPDRVKRFRSLARALESDYDGKVPSTRDELTSLPGVGDYVAGAVLSFGQNKQEWIVDVNVVRVLGRYFGVPVGGEARRKPHIIEMAKRFSNTSAHKKANWAILDFAAVVCTARTPSCQICALRKQCRYFTRNN